MKTDETSVRRHRKRVGLTLDELARKAELPMSTVWRIDSGKHAGSPRTLRALSMALKVPVDALMPEDTKPAPTQLAGVSGDGPDHEGA